MRSCAGRGRRIERAAMTTTSQIAATTVRRSLRSERTDIAGLVFAGLLLVSLLFSLAVLAILVGDQLIRGLPVFAERGMGVLTSNLASNPARAGLEQGLIG